MNIQSYSCRGLSPSLDLSAGFSVIAHLLRPVPGDTQGDPRRLAPQGSGERAVLVIYGEPCGCSAWPLIGGRGSGPPGSFVVGMGLCFLPLSFPFRAFLLQPEQLYVTAAPQRLPLRANWIRQGASAGRAEGTA